MEQFLVIAFCLLIYWLLVIYLPAKMAATRGRSPLGWALVSVFISPIVAVLLLVVIGDSATREA